jgi:hypothetical protein
MRMAADQQSIPARRFIPNDAVLAGAFAVSGGCLLTEAAVGPDPGRRCWPPGAMPAWVGLAIFCGRLLGRIYSWSRRWVALCVRLYWGATGGGTYRWWEFPAQPAGHLPSVLLAAGLFALGFAVYALSPWRLYRIRRANPVWRDSVPAEK